MMLMDSKNKSVSSRRNMLCSAAQFGGSTLRGFSALMLLAPMMLLAIGCGGGSGASQPAPPTVTSISASCSQATVQTGQTSQCTATVMGTGSYSSAVSWSVNSTPGGSSTLGTISSSGLYTAPATIAIGSANVSVVASSQSSPAITGSSSISLSYPSPKITSVAPTAINAGSAPTVVTIQGSNFTSASSVYLGSSPISTSFVSSSTLQATIPASSLSLAGTLNIDAANPQPGGGSSASQQINVVPQLVSVTPTSAPVGGSVALQLTGVDSSNASSVVVSFGQTGRTFTAAGGTLTSTGGTPALTIAVPSGLAPASASAPIGAPAQITASVNSIAATATLPFIVQPPTHAGEISPATVQTGLSAPVTFAGVATAFDGSTTITSDDPGITFTGSAANSSTIFLSNMNVAAGTKLGAHAITVTAQGSALAYTLQVVAPVAAAVISSASPTSGAPASAITITGTGFGTDAGTSVVLDFSYAGAEVQTFATASSATEIDSFMPVLIDPDSGSVYAGPVSLAVIINGQPSNTFSITLSPLPANSSAVGTTTLAAIDQAISNATNAQAQLATPSLLSSDQADSANALFAATVASLNTFRANVVTAASGETVTNPDGTTFDASSVDVLDRLLQTSGTQNGVTPALASVATMSGLRPLAQSATASTDIAFAQAGQQCSSFDTFKQFNKFFGLATNAVCLASVVFPPAAPVCGLMAAYTASATIVTAVGGAICDAEPDTLGAVTPSPPSIDTFVNGPIVVEMPQGTFESSPHQAANGVVSLIELVLDRLGDSTAISQFFTHIGVGETLGKTLINTLTGDFDQFLDNFADDKAPAWGAFTSTTVPLTMSTTSLIPDRNSLVGTSGLTVTPGSQTGETFLSFDTSAFRMFDATGKVTTEPTLVPGNMVPVSVGVPLVIISPSSATLLAGSTEQFTATVQGATNTAVNWSVNGIAGGNSTVGTITAQGLYTAPTSIPSPATVSVTATSQAQPAGSASASVTISSASIAVSPTPIYIPVGATQQFLATIQGTTNTSLYWSVDGIPGGNATVGTITEQGLYTAPASVPSKATVSIAANNTDTLIASVPATATVTTDSYIFYTVGYSCLVNGFASTNSFELNLINDNRTMIGKADCQTGNDAEEISLILKNGAFTTIQEPGTAETVLTGFNNTDIGLGYYCQNFESTCSNFVYQNGKISACTVPDCQTTTQPVAINNNGDITGGDIDLAGFLYSNGSLSEFRYPSSYNVITSPISLNDQRTIVGSVNIGGCTLCNYGFTYKSGTFSLIDADDADHGYFFMSSVNNSDEIVGSYSSSTGGNVPFVTVGGARVPFSYPGATIAEPRGVNNSGDIVGYACFPAPSPLQVEPCSGFVALRVK